MKKIFVSFLLLLFCLTSFSQLSVKQHQANYIFGFARLMKWTEYKDNQVIVNVIGESLVLDYLNQLAYKNQVSGRKLLAKQSNFDNATDCNILFVTTANSYLVPALSQKCANTSVLIITEEEGLTNEGADISFDYKKISTGDSTLSYTYNFNSINQKRIAVAVEFFGYGLIQ